MIYLKSLYDEKAFYASLKRLLIKEHAVLIRILLVTKSAVKFNFMLILYVSRPKFDFMYNYRCIISENTHTHTHIKELPKLILYMYRVIH